MNQPAGKITTYPVIKPLRVSEIFYSLQGESLSAGLPTVFIRLTGCPLRCHYCDTAYAFHGGRQLPLAEIMATVARYAPRYVTVTGGEPLAQRACRPLLCALCDRGYRVSLETSGAVSLAGIDTRVIKVMDLKTPASGETARNRYANIALLERRDQIKFVLCDRKDYEWARARLAEYQLTSVCEVLFAPAWGQLEARTLAEWILADQLDVRLQLQLHKILWGDAPGR